jgi:hypothetical protein
VAIWTAGNKRNSTDPASCINIQRMCCSAATVGAASLRTAETGACPDPEALLEKTEIYRPEYVSSRGGILIAIAGGGDRRRRRIRNQSFYSAAASKSPIVERENAA